MYSAQFLSRGLDIFRERSRSACFSLNALCGVTVTLWLGANLLAWRRLTHCVTFAQDLTLCSHQL